MRQIKTQINQSIKNILGWRTSKKIVVFSVDDYGNVRLASKKARENLDKSGLKIMSRFDAYDTLETREDMEALFEALSQFKDHNGDHPVFTAFSVPMNINFERIEEENFTKFFYETLPETYTKLSNLDPSAYERVWELWKDGIDKKLIHPEFHGREHLNLKIFDEKLAKKDKELLINLKNRSFTSITDNAYPNASYTAAFDFEDFDENRNFEAIIKDGLNQFESVFGFRSRHFNPPGGREHPVIHKWLHDGGIEYIDTPFFKHEHQGNGKYKKKLNWTGKTNQLGQIFQVRNCVFEPTHDRGFDWVNYTFKQVETAFRWNRPAIISSHRVNFCGHIDPDNRKRGLTALKELLKRIVTSYPDVEFMKSSKLGDLIWAGKQKVREG